MARIKAYDTAMADRAYEREVARLGLYGQAFYGWNATRTQRAALNRAWRKALRTARERTATA